MTDIIMPRLSDSMEEGTIIAWLKPNGATITRGDELAEIETDKATMIYEADASGVLERVAAEGDTLPVGAVIGRLLAAAEDQPVTAQQPDGSTTPAEPETSSSREAAAADAPEKAPSEPRVKASPLARRVAADLGVDLRTVTGSGRAGRIVRADVDHAAETEHDGSTHRDTTPEPPAAATADSTAAAPQVEDDVTVVELNHIQKTIARRMTEAAQVPTFTLNMDVDATDLLSIREQMRASHDPLPSVNDFVVRAVALTLRDHPRVNGSYVDDAWHLHRRVNVGVAVAAGDVLLVPVVHDADTLAVTAITETSRRLAEAARDGNITPPQLSGGTFTVSNLGMMGVTSFTAIITPGQAAILAVGSSSERVVFVEDAVTARQVMTVTLTCDHRIINGADGAAFLAALRDRLQSPMSLLS